MKSEGAKIVKISEIIIDWYKKNKRELPWRKSSDPYLIWLSEIIMQQTRVNQGLEYYVRFSSTYPDVYSLASAKDDHVMRLWQGLGYYSRARNLLVAARQVVEQYDGVFPSDISSLKMLKGVGDYTAAAIASIAYDVPVAVVDGNVNRVISRIFGIDIPVNTTEGEKQIKKLAAEMLDETQPGTHNQAMMEFGALQCTPVNPKCTECPIQNSCEAFAANKVADLPLKLKKVKQRKRYFTFLVLQEGESVYIRKRVQKDIWQDLYEFPLMEHDHVPSPEKLSAYLEERTGMSRGAYRITKISELLKHQLSHQTLFARFMHVEILQNNFIPGESWQSVNISDLSDYALPRLIDRYLESSD